MKTLKTLTIAAAIVLSAVLFGYNSTSAGSSNDLHKISFKGADTTDGGIKNPGGGDNPYPGR